MQTSGNQKYSSTKTTNTKLPDSTHITSTTRCKNNLSTDDFRANMMQIINGQMTQLQLGNMKCKYGEVNMDKLIFEPSCVPEDKRLRILKSLSNGHSSSYGSNAECITINGVSLSAQDLGLVADEPMAKKAKNVHDVVNEYKHLIEKEALTGDEMGDAISALIKVHHQELGKVYVDGILCRRQKAMHRHRCYNEQLQELLCQCLVANSSFANVCKCHKDKWIYSVFNESLEYVE